MRQRTLVRVLPAAIAVCVLGGIGRHWRVAAQVAETTPTETATSCAPTMVRVGTTRQPMPAAQDINFGKCLFSSRVDFNQSNPQGMFATCSGCHPSNRTDGGTHPVLITRPDGTFIGNRQVPNLLNVSFNVPLGWDGRHGGVLGNQASIIAAIKSAAIGAINSPVEMAGRIDPNGSGDAAKLAALAAYIVSKSPTGPPAGTGAGAATDSPAFDAETLARIKTGSEVFFGRSASTAGLLAAGKACVTCHPPPFFTDNKIQTNVLHPSAAYDFGFPHGDGTVGPMDKGAGLVTITDSSTGVSVQVGTFKTPALHRFYPDGAPSLHSGIFSSDDRLFRFYEKSLGFKLAAGESTGLHYWLVNCPQGPERSAASIPAECTPGALAPNPSMSLDGPATGSVVQQPFVAGGWAVDKGAVSGSGVDAVHVWAFRVSDGQPFFVAQGQSGGVRGDVGAAFGGQYTTSGFTFVIQGLAPGVYDLGVYARSTVTSNFNQNRIVRITVK